MSWELENQRAQIKGKGEILCGVPYKRDFSARVVRGFMGLDFPDYYSHVFQFLTGQPLDITRNIMVSYALQNNCSYVFFLDEDIILNRNTLKLLKETNMPIMSATYFARNPPYNVVANIKQSPISRDMMMEKKNTAPQGQVLMEVEEVGMGACLIDTRVFQRLAQKFDLPFFCMQRHPGIPEIAEYEKSDTGYYLDYKTAQQTNYRCNACNNTLIAPFFEYRLGKYQDNSLSEDYYFCKLARQAGFSVYIALHVEVGHEITTFMIDSNGLTNSTLSAGIV